MSKPNTFRCIGVNHIGLASKDPEATRKFFGEVLGLSFLGEELVKEQQTNTVMFSSSMTSGITEASRLEILAPESPGAGPIAKFLEKKGGGIHHIALSVDHIEAAISHLLAHGVSMIDKAPRKGAHDTLIAFVHPASTGGILVELVQENS